MSSVAELIAAHDRAREGCLPFVPSENATHPAVARALASDLSGRYAHEFYGGSRAGAEALAYAKDLACEVFGVQHAFLEALSGNVADLAVLFAFSEPGGTVAMVPRNAGGYPLGPQWFGRERVDLVVDPDSFEFDVEASLDVAREADVTVLGCSVIPFPHPVDPFEGVAKRLVFDGAHVLGLIATGAFPHPLDDGADLLIGSTHKSFPGPQGGMVLTNDDEVAEQVRWFLEVNEEDGIGLVDNPHPARIMATAATLELLRDTPEYGERVVENSKAMAGALTDLGVPVRFGDRGHSETHQVVLDVTIEEAEALRDRLDAAGIFIDGVGRVGTAEATWRGLGPEDMEEAAACIADVHDGAAPADERDRVAKIAARMSWLAPE